MVLQMGLYVSILKNNNNIITLLDQPSWILRLDSLSPSQQNQLYSEKDWLTYEVN